MGNKFLFSGHETFICKQFWLKKGFDYLNKGLSFSDKDATVQLGVGKNMVSAIQFWFKSFGMLEENGKTPNILAKSIFLDETGFDPYTENIGTIWLLHYLLVSSEKSSLYSLVFNEFRKERQEFARENLFQYVQRKCVGEDYEINENTLKSDIDVFAKSYVKPDYSEKMDVEESFTGLLLDLDLVKRQWRETISGQVKEYLVIANESRADLPCQIVLYVILDMLNDLEKNKTITFKQLQTEHNSPGMVFALSNDGLYDKIENITKRFPQVIFADTAGVQTVQFKEPLTKMQVLYDYYHA